MDIIERAGVTFEFFIIVNKDIKDDLINLNKKCILLQKIVDELIQNRFDEEFECVGGNYHFNNGIVTDKGNVKIYW